MRQNSFPNQSTHWAPQPVNPAIRPGRPGELPDGPAEHDPMIRIYDRIGQPVFKRHSEMTEAEVPSALRLYLQLLKLHQVCLPASAGCSPRELYRFLTEEVFEMHCSSAPDTITLVLYEDYHPDHAAGIRSVVSDFFSGWSQGSPPGCLLAMDPGFLLEDGSRAAPQQVRESLSALFGRFLCFRNFDFSVRHLSFEWKDKTGKGLGQASGFLRYEAWRENGELISIAGNYKLCLANECNAWRIYSMVLPVLTI